MIRSDKHFVSVALSSRLRSAGEARQTVIALRDVLRDQPNDSAADALAERLARAECCASVLCDPAELTLQEALAIARRVARHNPSLDTLVLRLVQPNKEGVITDDSFTCRAFAIVNEVTTGTRVMPMLIKILRLAQDRVVSRLILIMSRVRKDAVWLEPYCRSPDPRIRANSIEALWGNSDRNAIALMTNASKDPNHRVAVNALLGLYIVGVAQVVAELIKIADHRDPQWRAAAAWAMGQIDEVTVLDTLRKLMADPDRRVRGAALRAMVRVRKCEEQDDHREITNSIS